MPVYPPHALEPTPPPLKKKTNILGTPSAADMSPAPSRCLWRLVLPPAVCLLDTRLAYAIFVVQLSQFISLLQSPTDARRLRRCHATGRQYAHRSRGAVVASIISLIVTGAVETASPPFGRRRVHDIRTELN